MNFEETVDFLLANGFRMGRANHPLTPTKTAAAGWEYVSDPHYEYIELRGLNCNLMVIQYAGKEPRVQADNDDCFDKWTKCPINLPLPRNPKQAKRLLAMLHHLGSADGYELSNGYGYLNVNSNPYHYQGKRWDKYLRSVPALTGGERGEEA